MYIFKDDKILNNKGLVIKSPASIIDFIKLIEDKNKQFIKEIAYDNNNTLKLKFEFENGS